MNMFDITALSESDAAMVEPYCEAIVDQAVSAVRQCSTDLVSEAGRLEREALSQNMLKETANSGAGDAVILVAPHMQRPAI